MSLLINDMDMPKCCMECICLEAFDDEIYGRQHFCELLGIDALAKEHSRHKKCPLSEIPTPHGRLIDADEIRTSIESMKVIESAMPVHTQQQIFDLIINLISNVATVIGAED